MAQVSKRYCKGHKKDGSPCGNYAMKGQLVCRSHDGASPQARAAAERRMALQAIDPTSSRGVWAART